MMLINKGVSFVRNSFQRISNFPWIYALFSVGALLRLSGFTVGKLWYDEIFSLEMSRQNLFEMINALKITLSPPGWEILLWFVTRIFGWNAFGIRLPSVIASIITLWILHRIGISLMFTRSQLIASMTIVALLPYQLIYAQMGRVYALFTMFYLLGIYAILTKQWIVLGVCTIALFWSHNVSFMFVPGLFFIALITHPRFWKRIVFVFLISVIAYIPWLMFSLAHAASPVGWFAPLTLDSFIFDFLISLFGYNLPLLFMLIAAIELITLCLVASVFPLAKWIFKDMRRDFKAFRDNRKIIRTANDVTNKDDQKNLSSHSLSMRILFLAFAIPLLLMSLASLFFQNILFARTIFLITIPFIMWLTAIFVVPQLNIIHIIMWVVSLVVLIAGAITWSPTQLGGDLGNLQFTVNNSFLKGRHVPISENINGFEPGDAFFHDTGFSALLFKYYFPQKANYIIDGSNVVGIGDVQATKFQIPQAAPDNIPAQRLWVVMTSDKLMNSANNISYERANGLIVEYDCPIVSYLYYPQSSNFLVYLCDIRNK